MLNGAQVHLLFNHLPILGIPFSLLLVGVGLWRKSLEIQKFGLGALVLVGLLSVVAFKSGDAAEDVVEEAPGISESMIHEHEESAELAFWFLEGIAVLSLGGLVYFRAPRTLPTWFTLVVLTGMLVGSGLMANAGHLGGLINHPEIRASEGGPGLPLSDDDLDDH